MGTSRVEGPNQKFLRVPWNGRISTLLDASSSHERRPQEFILGSLIPYLLLLLLCEGFMLLKKHSSVAAGPVSIGKAMCTIVIC